MKTTDLTTNDNDIEVYFGGLKYRDAPRKEAYGHVKYLYTDLTDIRKYYIRLGFHLDEFARHMYYTDFGYATLEDFCQSNLGLDKSAVSRCIGVYREFSAKDDQKSGSGIISKGCAMELSEKWKDYSYTQLCEMLPLSPEDRMKVLPSMSCKQIRDYKKELKNIDKEVKDTFVSLDEMIRKVKESAAIKQREDSEGDPVATTQQEGSEGDAVALTQPKIFSYDEYVKKNSGIIEQNYIKSCDPVKFVNVCIFDKRGRKILCNHSGQVLQIATNENNNCLVIRMSCAFDPAVIILGQQPDQKGDHDE